MDMNMINDLGDDLLCHIISFLPIREAAFTSVLSKRWRNLFAFPPNVHLDDQGEVGLDEEGREEDFINFVDRVLDVSGNLPMRKKISIKCGNSIDKGHVTRWINKVLKHGVLKLDIDVIAGENILLPLEIFSCKTLVELKLSKGFRAILPENVSLPALKKLFLNSVYFMNARFCVLGKLLSACPVIEELTILGEKGWQNTDCCRSVSSSTLKKLTIRCTDVFCDMTIDTPNLVYLECTGFVMRDYPTVSLESLVKAKLDLNSMCCGGNPRNLFKGLTNVEVLELSTVGTWLRIFRKCPEAIPVFSNLIRLSIKTQAPYYYHNHWKFLPMLVKKSPNLETLVIKGPLNAIERDGGESSCRVLKISEYRGKTGELEKMNYFLEKLSCLELGSPKIC